MLNSGLKKEALEALERAVEAYEHAFKVVTDKSGDLYQKRKSTADQVIQLCERYISALANSPKEFDKSISEFKAEYFRFTELAREIELESRKHEQISGSVAGAGAAVGVGVAAFGPTAAMAIATTFGTASTGTAISALSGAAATNAALAWLGGGALAAGGGGMAAGNALLALAGPVGWAIGGFALAGGVFLASKKNADVAEKATQETVRVKSDTAKLQAASREIDELLKLTQKHVDGVRNQLKELVNNAPKDYKSFTRSQKETLAALINNIESLSMLLNKKIA